MRSERVATPVVHVVVLHGVQGLALVSVPGSV